MTYTLPPPRLDLLVHSPTPASLIPVLELLLEASPVLTSKLAPDLHATFKQSPPKTYAELLDTAALLVAKWDVADQALFLGSHPRIGETIGLSSASAKEQQPGQNQQQTPGEVLKRLSMLNALYEEAYPGLRFVTFVNGRPRGEVVPEIQSTLNLVLDPPSASTPEPRLHALREKLKIHPAGSGPWRSELKRGTEAMWAIAQSRLGKMGVQ